MSSLDREQGLQRKLTSWQLTMIAIGGAIGVAGPGVLISYIFGAFIAMIMGYALAEMASVYPVAGAFGVYADKYVSPWAGFTVRVTYWFAQTVAIGAEITAVGLYFGYWLPEVPSWIWVIGSSALVLGVNAANVKVFGTLESWFAMIKVVAIAAFIVVGGALIIGIGQPAIGLSNLTAHGGFLPHGWTGVWLALTLVITSYMGIEVIAVTAGEAQHCGDRRPAHRQSFRKGLSEYRNPVRRGHHELRRDFRCIVEREYEPLSLYPHDLLLIAGGLRAGTARFSGSAWCAAGRSVDFRRRDDRSDRARPRRQTGIPPALWHGGGRDVFRVDHDSRNPHPV